MPRKYTKMEVLSEEVFRRKAAGETNRQIAESYGLTTYQIKQLAARQNCRKRAIANGYVPHDAARQYQYAKATQGRNNAQLS